MLSYKYYKLNLCKKKFYCNFSCFLAKKYYIFLLQKCLINYFFSINNN